MIDDARIKLEQIMEQAVDLRFSFEYPDFSSGPVELHNSLVEVQLTLTKLEKLLSDAVKDKAMIERKEAKLKMIWQEAFDRALTKKNVSFGSEFVTGKEKIAEANLSAFNEAKILRVVNDDLLFATEVVDIARLHYYGLDKVRQDIRKRLDMSQTDYYS